VFGGKYLTTGLAAVNPAEPNVRICAPGTEFRISRHVSVTPCFQRRSQQRTPQHEIDFRYQGTGQLVL